MSTTSKRGLIRLAGLGGAIATGVAVAVLCVIPLPSLFLTPVTLTVNPTPSAPHKVCPGGLVDVIGSKGDATTFQGFASPTFATMSSGNPAAVSPLAAPDNAAKNPAVFPQLLTGEVSTDPAKPVVIAGAQSQYAKSDVISGLASSACGEASTDQWLVGGSTEVGRTTLLLLNNPLEVESVVSLEIFGENGLVDAPGTTNIIVPPQSQRILSLAAFAPNLVEPVVHVTTSGGQVYATLQQTVTRVVTPSGVEYVSPGAPASTLQVIPGVALSGQAGADGEGGQVTNDLAPGIRVLIPGDVDAEVTATIIGVSGEPVVVKSRLTARHTIQLPFSGVSDGVYTVIVTANVPVVASARSVQSPGVAIAPIAPAAAAPAGAPAAEGATTPAAGGDFSWNASAVQLGGTALVPIPAGPNALLTLFNSGTNKADVALLSNGQPWQTVELPAGASRVVDVSGQVSVTITNAPTVHASVTQRAVGQGTAYPVTPASRLGSAVSVFPR